MRTRTFILALSIILAVTFAHAQVGVNSTGGAPDPSAMLDVQSADKGVLVPRVSLQSTTDVTTVPSPATSLLVYNSNAGMTGGGVGFYYYTGSEWAEVGGKQSLSLKCDTLFISGGNYVILEGLANFGQPTTANAGPDQSALGTAVTLAGNTPVAGTGLWTIISGSGGSLANPLVPNTTFSGVTGNTYLLEWSISNSCNTSRDTMQIDMISAKRVFVTSSIYNGNLGGLSGADAICAAHAASASLGSNWTAWLSTSSVNAKDRIVDDIYARIDGQIVANSKADLIDGSIQITISVDENGANIGGAGVWTGTDQFGIKNLSPWCNDWTNGTSTPRGIAGTTGQSTADWTYSSNNQCHSTMRLYCFEQ